MICWWSFTINIINYLCHYRFLFTSPVVSIIIVTTAMIIIFELITDYSVLFCITGRGDNDDNKTKSHKQTATRNKTNKNLRIFQRCLQKFRLRHCINPQLRSQGYCCRSEKAVQSSACSSGSALPCRVQRASWKLQAGRSARVVLY